MTKMYDVVGGVAIPDVSHLGRDAAIARKAEVARLLAETRDDYARSAERDQLKREDQALADRLREIKEKQKAENARRNFAGLHSPLWDAVLEHCPPDMSSRLEQAALEKLAAREQKKFDLKNV